ncbi:laccase-3-like [Anneissia japonica]|uniref:laccase-3-like n=1 Tax=Anneissia japonica TaxID=1529436 RepID=UPI0014258E44|nr:laccase-3-like [Anneissia japonica]
MMLTDWSDIVAVEIALKANVPAMYPRTPSITILMNGKGERIDFFDESGQAYKTPKAMFEVEAGMRYRVRLIGAFVAACTTEFYIENHNMTIIGTDGHETIPHEIGSLKIGSGERYDFVLHANAVPSTYCIHAVGLKNSSCLTYSTYILKYKSSSLDVPVCREDDLQPVPHYMGSDSNGLFSSIDLVSLGKILTY